MSKPPTDQTWTTLSAMSAPRVFHACGLVTMPNGDKRILAAGGTTTKLVERNVDTWEYYDLSNKKQSIFLKISQGDL